jgi:26S proteasome regulatory subunit T1
VARCTKIINPNTDDAKYVINIKQIAKFVVGLGDKVSGRWWPSVVRAWGEKG